MSTPFLESTARGMNDWWHENFAPVRRGGRTIYSGPWRTVVEQTVTWIDDRNEARRLGITVEELMISRQVARRMAVDGRTDDARALFTIDVPSPRFHAQLTGITG